MHASNPKSMIYFSSFIVLVAVLSSFLARWGTEAIAWAVIVAVVIVGGTPIAFKRIKKHWQKAITSEPSKLAFALAPSGYRRDRLGETDEEYIAQTVVIPTPNRPLVLADPSPVQRALADNGSHAKQLYEIGQGRTDTSRAVVPTRSRSIEPVKALDDPNNPILDLAPGCTPRINDVLGRSICGLGIRGSGKTNLAARLIERIGLLPNIVPMAIFDDAQDYASLPEILERAVVAGSPDWTEQWRYQDYYWEVTEENAEEIGYLVFEDRIQLILQIHTYKTLEIAAHVMCDIIKGMFAWADEKDPSQRIPCMVFLDEAQRYLPQNQSVSPIAPEETKALLRWFDALNSIGRKKGFTPAIFTQRPAQIQKPAIVGSEIYFLGLQTFPNDLDKYEEITGKDKLSRAVVQKFNPGDFALFESGEVSLIHAHTRQSEHRGTTPSYAQAGKRDHVKSVATQKIRSVQTVNFDDEEINANPEYDEDERYPFSPSKDFGRQPETPRMLVPVIPDKGRRADEIEDDLAILLWNNGHGSRRKLAKALGTTENQASHVMKRIGVTEP